MKRWVLVAAVGWVAACGHTPAPDAAPTASPTLEAVPGAFVGECGGLTADQLAPAGTDLRPVSRNPFRCDWQFASGDLSFEWFRGTTMVKHHDVAGTPVAVADRHGVSWSDAHACEVAVESGGGDFITWTLRDNGRSGADLCRVATQFAAATLHKAKA